MNPISNNQTKNISFKQRINITSSLNHFNSLPLIQLTISGKEVRSWHIQGAKFLNEGFTREMSVCTATFINNIAKKSQGYLAHLAPRDNSPNIIEEYLTNAIKRLKDSQKQISGVITGGLECDESCYKNFELLKDIFNHEKVNYSVIWGLKGNFIDNQWINMYASALKKQSLININSTQLNEISNLKDLKSACSDVFISKKDTLDFIL